MRRVLVVANQTAESEELLQALRERAGRDECEFTVLIPATPHGISWAANMFADQGAAEAKEHRGALVERLRGAGLEVSDAIVGDPEPLAAVQDACNAGDYDEVIVSTLPHKVSRWLHLDLPSKVEHATGLPVTSIETSKAETSTP
jgi:nucleotide-binding universal stress UspA family protein